MNVRQNKSDPFSLNEENEKLKRLTNVTVHVLLNRNRDLVRVDCGAAFTTSQGRERHPLQPPDRFPGGRRGIRVAVLHLGIITKFHCTKGGIHARQIQKFRSCDRLTLIYFLWAIHPVLQPA